MTNEQMMKEISRLKKEKNAVILGHYYQRGPVQDVADYCGDSLALSQIAATTDADIIVFCGVHFMAETAKILSPDKKVLLPVKEAGCPMADMVTAAKLSLYKEKHPEKFVVCYVNSTAQVKALSDICVTSSNAEKIISNFKDKEMLYVPDKNLGTYMKTKFGLNMEVWPGFCCIHDNVTIEIVDKMKERYPNAELIVHPETQLDIINAADFVGSTKGLLEYVTKSSHKEFLVGTENGILHQMKKHNPDKIFHLLDEGLSCFDMKLTYLEDVYNALKYEQHEVIVDEEISKKAKQALDRMLELSK